MTKASPRRPSAKGKGRPAAKRNLGGGPRYLRGAVLIAMVISLVVLISLAISAPSQNSDVSNPAPSSGTSPASAGDRGGTSEGPGAAASLLDLASEVPQMVVTESGYQTLTDIAANTSDPAAERKRLGEIGFREAAITVGIKSPESGGLIAGSDLVIQIVRFSEAGGARSQIDRDRNGALAADFGAESPGTVSSVDAKDGGFTFAAHGPPTPRGQSAIRGSGLQRGTWTVSVVASSPPGVSPPSEEFLSSLAERQAAKLEGAGK